MSRREFHEGIVRGKLSRGELSLNLYIHLRFITYMIFFIHKNITLNLSKSMHDIIKNTVKNNLKRYLILVIKDIVYELSHEDLRKL